MALTLCSSVSIRPQDYHQAQLTQIRRQYNDLKVDISFTFDHASLIFVC